MVNAVEPFNQKAFNILIFYNIVIPANSLLLGLFVLSNGLPEVIGFSFEFAQQEEGGNAHLL